MWRSVLLSFSKFRVGSSSIRFLRQSGGCALRLQYSFPSVSRFPLREYAQNYSHTFSADDEAKLCDVVLHRPSQVAVHIRDSMQKSRRRIIHFRNCVTYVAIILQSHLHKKGISLTDTSTVVESLLNECTLLRQADMAHLLFRAALRFDRYGDVIRPSFLMLLYQSYRGNKNIKSIMRSIGDELKNTSPANSKHELLASIAYILSSDTSTTLPEIVSIDRLTSRDIAVLLECYVLAGQYEKMVDTLQSLFSRNNINKQLTSVEINALLSTAICSMKNAPSDAMQRIVCLGQQHSVSFSDAAGAALLTVRLTHNSMFDEVAVEEEKIIRDLGVKDPMPMMLSVCISRCAELLLRQSRGSEAEEYLLHKVETLSKIVDDDFLKSCRTDEETNICIAVLRGYGSLKALTKMKDFFDRAETCSLPNKHKLYEEVLRWYSHAGMAKEAIAIKEKMSAQHLYHTVHTYHYLFRALDTSYPQLVDKFYREMRYKSIRLDGYITPLLLRAFSEAKEWAKVESLYAESKADAANGSTNSFSARVVIQMLRCYRHHPERCKMVMEDAQKFNLIEDDNVQSECINVLTLNHQDEELEAFLSTISAKTPQIYRLLLRNAARKRVREDFDSILERAKRSAKWDEKLVITVITALSYFNDAEGVKKFVSLSEKNKWISSSIFYADAASAFARVGVPDEVGKAWAMLLQSGLSITMPVYNRFLDLYMHQNNIVKVQEVLDHMMETMPPNATTATTVIDMLGKMGRLEEMETVLKSMSSSMNAAPTVLTYHTVMSAYAKVGNITKMEAVRQRIASDGFSESSTTYNIRIEGYGRAKRFESIQEVLQERITAKIEMDENAYVLLLSIFTRERLAGNIEDLVREMISNGINFSNKMLAYVAAAFAAIHKTVEMEKFVKMLLAHPDCTSRDVEMVYMMYAKLRDTVKIQELLDNPSLGKTKNIYNTCIAAFAKTGEHAKVAFLLSEMEKEKFSLTRSTKIVLSSLLVKAGQGDLAQAILNSEDTEDLSTSTSTPEDLPIVASDDTVEKETNDVGEESVTI